MSIPVSQFIPPLPQAFHSFITKLRSSICSLTSTKPLVTDSLYFPIITAVFS